MRIPPNLKMHSTRPVATLRPQHAVLAHHLDQHAFAQAAVGDAQPRQRKGLADGIEDGAAREHQVGALDADAGVGGALLDSSSPSSRVDGGGDIGIAHPDAVDAPAIVARAG